MIRQNKNIRGIRIGGEEICLLQYADDTVIFLDGTEKSLKSALDLLFQFSKYSGLKPNYDKTKAIWIGSKINSKDTMCNESGINWTNDPFNVLGIIYTSNLNNMEDLNYNDKILKIEKDITAWSRRNLTVFGKITVIKSLLIPKLTHLFIALPRPNLDRLKHLEKLLYNFLWRGGKDKISRKVMVQNYEFGGCKMIHLDSYVKALKLTWVRRIINGESQWKTIFLELTKCNTVFLMQFGIDYYKKCEKTTKNIFWKEVLKTLMEFALQFKQQNVTDILYSPVWYNPKVKMGNQSIFYNKFYQKGFHIIKDFFNENGRFIDYEELLESHQLQIPFTTFHGLKTAIIASWPVLKQIDINDLVPLPYKPEHIKVICKDSKGSKSMYNIFISNLYQKPKSEEKWKTEFHLDDDFNWKAINKRCFGCTNDTQLLWFHYRVLHRILGTNDYLFKCNIKNSPVCNLCRTETESPRHLLFECRAAQEIWSQVEAWIRDSIGFNYSFTTKDIIFGCKDKILNLIALLTKQYIFQTSRKNHHLFINDVKRKIHYYFTVESVQFKIRGELTKFNLKWDKWTNLFSEFYAATQTFLFSCPDNTVL